MTKRYRSFREERGPGWRLQPCFWKNPRVIGVKNSSMPTQDIETFLRLGGENCVVFNGPDEQFAAGRAIGAQGGIGGTYAAMPGLFLKMDKLVREGRLEETRAIHAHQPYTSQLSRATPARSSA